MMRIVFIIILVILTEKVVLSQCCASSGNPVGGTVNIGSLNKGVLRTASFYSFSFSDKYYEGNKLYSGEIGSIEKALFSYIGLLSGYGISDKLTIEMETVYVINKTHVFKINGASLTGNGFSDAVISVRPRIYRSSDNQFEINCALGSNIPFSRSLQQVNGVTLPVDLQPSTGSYGLVIQSNIIKENSFRSISFLLVNRFERYFENKQDYKLGNTYSTSLYFSKHFSVESQQLSGWTILLQLKNQIRNRSERSGQTINASGNCSFFLIPQISCSIRGSWHFYFMYEMPIYQDLNDIQLSNGISSSVSIIKDINLYKSK